MKIFLNTTEDWKEIKDAIRTAEDYLRDFGIKYTLNSISIDLSNDAYYETTKSWSWFKRVTTKSLGNTLIRALGVANGGLGYDYYGLVVDYKKSRQQRKLYGQHNPNTKTIEIYAQKTKKDRHGFPFTTSNLIHETLHALSSSLNKQDKLHEYLDKYGKFDEYITYLNPKTDGEQPLIRRQAETFINLANTFYPNTNLHITSFYRSEEEQDELYSQGRTKAGKIVTNARGGESLHNYGVGFDIVDTKRGYDLTNKEWQRLAKLWKALTDGAGEWGGSWINFTDRPHFQNTLGYTLKDFQNNKVDYEKFK